MAPSASELVARFLRANGYEDTLVTYLREAGLPLDTGANASDNLTIEQILSEKLRYDMTLNFERLGVEDSKNQWTLPAPQTPIILRTLPQTSNVLSVSVEAIARSQGVMPSHTIVTTSACRRLDELGVIEPYDLIQSRLGLQDSPILSQLVIAQRYLICGSMSGRLTMFDYISEKIIAERRDHSKYVVKVACHRISEDDYFVATIGWDAKIFVYSLHLSHSNSTSPTLGEPLAYATLSTNPESILFLTHPETRKPLLLLTRRDSAFLYYYSVPDMLTCSDKGQSLDLLGKQNLAPHSNAWISFTPSDVAICPTDASIVAVATSTLPHMKIILVRLLLPPSAEMMEGSVLPQASNETPVPLTQAVQSRAELALQDKEEAAIIIQCSTMASQTPYSTPTVVWRPDGSGVWVNSDDGLIRGIEASTGKVVTKLEGHQTGSKIRCLWSGRVQSPQGTGVKEQEILVSGGFDQRLIVWRLP